MNENKDQIKSVLKLLALIIAVSALLIAFIRILKNTSNSPTEKAVERKLAKEHESFKKLRFDLIDPELSPKEIHQAVERGYHIIIDTQKYAAQFVGNKLNCTNCHFSAGNTIGGENGSISLAGIAAAYPDYNKRFNKVISLSERINNCFTRSLNGKPLPLGSDEMIAIDAYLHWISKDFPIYQPIPWRGLTPIEMKGPVNVERGEAIFNRSCALCHGKKGEGSANIPPVWGEGSFNNEAGMNKLETLSAFIHANMPYEDPTLTVDESFDVAAFILKQPRPEVKEPHD